MSRIRTRGYRLQCGATKDTPIELKDRELCVSGQAASELLP